MLGELHDLSFGPASPIVAWIFATVGSLLGIILAARARTCTGPRRLRLVAYATVSVAGAGIWLPALTSILALRVDGSVVRLNPDGLGLGLGAAVIATAGALLLLCYGSIRLPRLLAGALLLGAGVVGTDVVTLRCIATGGAVSGDATLTLAAFGVGLVAAAMLALLLGAAPSLRWSVGMSLPLGLALTAVNVIGAAALAVRPGPGGPIAADDVPGLSQMQVGAPAIVLAGVVLALMWYFALGTATIRDLRLIFEPGAATEQIDPELIEQITARVALSSTALAGATGWGDGVWVEQTVPMRALPLLGGAVASAFARGVRDYRGEPLFDEEPAVGPDEARVEPPALEGWRPVPGWGAATASRARLTPPAAPQPAQRAPRPGSRWDQRGWDERDAGDRNEQRVGARARATNSRQGQVPSRAPAGRRAVVPVGHGEGGRAFVPVRAESPEPLPRRNARA